MNLDQIKIITQYLKIETNYAVIINGDYGVGKTYFYKNFLMPEIKKVSLPYDEGKKFTPIHISLFGFKTLEEVQTGIFLELFPILQDKKLKLAAGILKTIIRGIAEIKGAGNIDIDKHIGDLTPDANDWLNYKDLVICFDDLDRRSDSLKLSDFFGFINSLVENQGAKVLIIANEPVLLKDSDYNSNLREKVIGVSIHYKPITKLVFEQIIKERYSSSFTIYYDFLIEHKFKILSVIEKNQNNFRNLIFFLEHFKTIFDPLENLFQTETDFTILKIEKLKAILDFTIAIAFEYKLGLLNVSNINEIHSKIPEFIWDELDINLENIQLASLNSNIEKKDEKPNYFEGFKSKYFNKSRYYFFNSILEYIIGLTSFKIENLKVEIENYFLIKDGLVPKHEKILKGLEYLDCLNLTDKEYRKHTQEMLSYVDEGIYKLSQYSTVFHFATRFNNLLNYNLENLKKRFKKGIRKGKQNYLYEGNMNFYMHLSSNIDFKSDVDEIVQYCLKINESLKETNEKKLEKLFDLFLKEFDDFFDTISAYKNEYELTPFWNNFNEKRTYNRIIKLENKRIWELGHYFRNRYQERMREDLHIEKAFVQELKKLMDKPKSRKLKTLKNASLDYLYKCLIEGEKNFPL